MLAPRLGWQVMDLPFALLNRPLALFQWLLQASLYREALALEETNSLLHRSQVASASRQGPQLS
jgi:hypothetical protein